ncbi:MAG: hypothetical protein V3V19_11275 [Cocleimonas sp.]
MVEFPLQAVVSVVTKDAENSIDNLGSSFEKTLEKISNQLDLTNDYLNDIFANTLPQMDDAVEASSQKQAQSWSRIQKGVAGATAVVGGFFGAMIKSSPELGAALAEIGFQFEMVFSVLGDRIAPLFEALIPYIQKLTDLFMGLDGDVQTFIATGITLAAGLGIISTALGTMGLSFTLLLGPVGLAILAIAALFLAYKTNFGGLKDFVDSTVGALIDIFSNWYSENEETIGNLIALFIELGKVILDALEPVVAWLLDVLQPVFIRIFESIMDTITNYMTILTGLLNFITGVFTGDWERAWDGIKQIFTGVWDEIENKISLIFDVFKILFEKIFGIDVGEFGGMLIDALMGGLNGLMGALETAIETPINSILGSIASLVDKIPGVKKPNWKLDIDIPTFDKGGIVGQTGTTTDDVLALVGTDEGIIDAGTMRSLSGGNNNQSSLGSVINVNFNNLTVSNRRDIDNIRNNAKRGVKEGILGITQYNRGGYTT